MFLRVDPDLSYGFFSCIGTYHGVYLVYTSIQEIKQMSRKFIGQENASKTSGVYLLTNTVNGKQYVGMTVNFQQRMRDHVKHSLRRKINYVISRAIRKYGPEAFKFEILHEFDEFDHDAVAKLEAKEIKARKTVETGYNFLEGSRGQNAYGKKWQEKCKEIWADPELRKKVASPGKKNPMYGRSRKGEKLGGAVTPPTEDQRQKMKDGHQKWLKRVKKEDRSASLKAGQEKFKNERPSEYEEWKRKVARPGELNGCYGSTFVWINDGKNHRRHDKDKPIPKGWVKGFLKTNGMIEARKRRVECIETGEVFESQTDAAKAYEVDTSKICLVCRGQRKKTGGYSWRYI